MKSTIVTLCLQLFVETGLSKMNIETLHLFSLTLLQYKGRVNKIRQIVSSKSFIYSQLGSLSQIIMICQTERLAIDSTVDIINYSVQRNKVSMNLHTPNIQISNRLLHNMNINPWTVNITYTSPPYEHGYLILHNFQMNLHRQYAKLTSSTYLHLSMINKTCAFVNKPQLINIIYISKFEEE